MLSRRALLTTAPLGAAAAAVWVGARGDLPFVTLAAEDTVDAVRLPGSPAVATTSPTRGGMASPAPGAPATTSTSATTAPTRTSTPSRVTESALHDALDDLAREHGLELAVAGHDVRSGRSFTHRSTAVVETASIAKVDILTTLLLQCQDAGRSLTPRESRLAGAMIRSSDYDSAWMLFRQVGAATGMAAANRRLGLRETTTTDASWGLTRTTAPDQLRLLAALQAAGTRTSPLTRRSAAVALDLMADIDGGQDWGVSAAARRGELVRLKNGWLPRSTLGRRWIINSIGTITGPGVDVRLAVLTQKSAASDGGIAAVERAALLTRRHLGA